MAIYNRANATSESPTLVLLDLAPEDIPVIEPEPNPPGPAPRGVYWNKRDKKWKAQACYRGKKYGLGVFDNIEDAEEAYLAFRARNRDSRRKKNE